MANPLTTIRKDLKALRRLLKRRTYLSAQKESDIVGRFHTLLYDSHIFHDRGDNVFWLGTPVTKCPFDLWIYQEMLHELRPDLIIECGTQDGGSALFLASICDLIGTGEVISIDIAESDRRPRHPRITYLMGSSTSDAIVQRVRAAAAGKRRVMAILDSDHTKKHVLAEMQIYAPLVTPGSYLIVEDTNLNGNPVVPNFGPGPREAVEEFMASCSDFEVDPEREKLFLTFNPKGYLRKRG